MTRCTTFTTFTRGPSRTTSALISYCARTISISAPTTGISDSESRTSCGAKWSGCSLPTWYRHGICASSSCRSSIRCASRNGLLVPSTSRMTFTPSCCGFRSRATTRSASPAPNSSRINRCRKALAFGIGTRIFRPAIFPIQTTVCDSRHSRAAGMFPGFCTVVWTSIRPSTAILQARPERSFTRPGMIASIRRVVRWRRISARWS